METDVTAAVAIAVGPVAYRGLVGSVLLVSSEVLNRHRPTDRVLVQNGETIS